MLVILACGRLTWKFVTSWSAANESVLECDPSPEPIRHCPVARSIIAVPRSKLASMWLESYRLEIDTKEGAEAHS
jgi:hypothetical protein